MASIFISYRRSDSAQYAARIYDLLESRFGRERVFVDVDAIDANSDFKVIIENAIVNCDVLIAIIGQQWLTVKDYEGKQRLTDRHDFVRFELTMALRRNIYVLPVLVGGASMPHESDLPGDLTPLLRHQALIVRDKYFAEDVDKLIGTLDDVLESRILSEKTDALLLTKDNSGSEDRRSAKLRATTNPLGLVPSFVFPVFSSRNAPYVQAIDEHERVSKFIPLEGFEFTVFNRVNRKLKVSIGGTAIYAFLFAEKDVVVGTKEQVVAVLQTRLSDLKQSPFTLLDVLEFIGAHENIPNVVRKIINVLPFSSREHAYEFAAIEGVKRDQLKFRREMLNHADSDGYINYWNLFSEMEDLVAQWGRIYIRAKLVRSRIGMSPKIRDMLHAFGLGSCKLQHVGIPVAVDSSSLPTLKQLSKYIIIVEIQILSMNKATIRACNPVSIQKRYLKKNEKKVIHGTSSKDYVCEILPDR